MGINEHIAGNGFKAPLRGKNGANLCAHSSVRYRTTGQLSVRTSPRSRHSFPCVSPQTSPPGSPSEPHISLRFV